MERSSRRLTVRRTVDPGGRRGPGTAPLRWRHATSGLLLLGMTSSGSAAACPVCFSAKEGTLQAYYGTTLLLSALPLLMLSGIVVWVVRRLRQLERTPEEPLSPPDLASSSTLRDLA